MLNIIYFYLLNKCSLIDDSTFLSREGKARCPSAKMKLWLVGLYGSTRSYASNRKYRERGNSEIGVNERILRQAAIKELVSLGRLRALLCDQFENWHVRTNMFEWSPAVCFAEVRTEGGGWENVVQGQVRRKRSSPDNLIIPTPDTIDIGGFSPLATTRNWLASEFPLRAFKFPGRIGIYFLPHRLCIVSVECRGSQIQQRRRFQERLTPWKRRRCSKASTFVWNFYQVSFFILSHFGMWQRKMINLLHTEKFDITDISSRSLSQIWYK